jgi:hypothetical protein
MERLTRESGMRAVDRHSPEHHLGGSGHAVRAPTEPLLEADPCLGEPPPAAARRFSGASTRPPRECGAVCSAPPSWTDVDATPAEAGQSRPSGRHAAPASLAAPLSSRRSLIPPQGLSCSSALMPSLSRSITKVLVSALIRAPNLAHFMPGESIRHDT